MPVRDLDEHRGAFEIQHLPPWCLSDVKRKPEDVRVRFAEMHEAGGDKGIHKLVQLECANPIGIQFE
jgi:hypothetical protein